MNPLFAPLPRSVRIGTREYPIRWDAHTALRILAAFEDDCLADLEKQAVMLSLFYPEIPQDLEKAAQLAVRFLNCGSDAPAPDGPRLYSFVHDAPLIYSAMRRSHGIDASQPMHWYTFTALFFDIGPDTLFMQIVALRQKQAAGTLSPDERRLLSRLGAAAVLPQHETPQEKAAAERFRALLAAGDPKKGGTHASHITADHSSAPAP